MKSYINDKSKQREDAYRTSFEQGNIDRSNLEANIDFLEASGLLPPDKKILEIGCGAGNLAGYLRNKGYDVIASDISGVALDKAVELHDNLPVCQMTAEKLGFEEHSFDLVLSFDVFEHIQAIEDHLKEVKRVLKDGGYYLFETPNKLTNIPLEILKTKRLNYRSYHPSLQTVVSLKELLRKHGFDVEITKVPIFNKFAERKIQAVFGRLIARVTVKVSSRRIPILIYPSFFVIAKVRK